MINRYYTITHDNKVKPIGYYYSIEDAVNSQDDTIDIYEYSDLVLIYKQLKDMIEG